MAEVFRIETDKVLLSWSGGPDPDTRPGSQFGHLNFSLRRPGAVFAAETWRAQVPESIAGDPHSQFGPRLLEETSYTLFARSKQNDRVELRHRDPSIIRALNESDHGRTLHGSVNFRSQVGRSRFTVVLDGVPELDFEVEVFPTKIDYTTDYEAILSDVQDILTSLALEYLRSTYQQALPTDGSRASRLEWLILLRHIIDDLERGLRYIQQHPRQGLIRERRSRRVETLRRPDSLIRRSVMTGRGTGPMIQGMNGLSFRSRLQENRALPTLDTAEHRWLAAQLVHIRRTLARIRIDEQRRIANVHGPMNQELLTQTVDELGELEQRIANLQRIEALQAAEGLPPPGFASLQLQTAPGYREARQACLILRRGLRVDGGPVGLSVKDIHLLYEYWCYLAIVRMVAQILDKPLPVERLLKVEQEGLRVQLRRGETQYISFDLNGNRTLEVTYNPQLSRSSTLFAQQPDIALTFHDPNWPSVRLILDAKYRIDDSKECVDRFGSPGPPQDAINVLHRYRDAIVDDAMAGGVRSERFKRTVVEGAALFPYDDRDENFSNSAFWKAIDRLGIGALPFLPSQTEFVEQWIRDALTRGGWSTADGVIPHISEGRVREWQDAAKEAVLVGVLRSEAAEHFEWIRDKRVYYTRYTPTQGRQIATRYLAIYSPSSLFSLGAVTHQATVERIEVVPRGKIRTPWTPRGSQNELQVLYRLGPLEERTFPIENVGVNGGTRFSQNRWTSKLALDRASELRELFLETEPEWRLYEELKANGVEFRTDPGRVRVQNPDDPTGRAKFLIGDWVVQYRGSAGFAMKYRTRLEGHVSGAADVIVILQKSPDDRQ